VIRQNINKKRGPDLDQGFFYGLGFMVLISFQLFSLNRRNVFTQHSLDEDDPIL